MFKTLSSDLISIVTIILKMIQNVFNYCLGFVLFILENMTKCVYVVVVVDSVRWVDQKTAH